MSRPCVFFDRDGVINRSPGEGRYVLKRDEFELMPGIVDVLRVVKDRGWAAVVVTSQRGVAKGLMSRADLDAIHDSLQSDLRDEGLAFLDIYSCTHMPEDRHWAKPNPGMILEAARKHDLDVARSIMIGDHDRDIVMGRRAGVAKTLRLRGEKPVGVEADYTLDNLLEVKELLEDLLGAAI